MNFNWKEILKAAIIAIIGAITAQLTAQKAVHACTGLTLVRTI